MAVNSAGWRPGNTPVDHLILDMLAWLAPHPRPYGEAMEAWRTSCPRLTVWEDAFDAGLVERRTAGTESLIGLTRAGEKALCGAGASDGRTTAPQNKTGPDASVRPRVSQPPQRP